MARIMNGIIEIFGKVQQAWIDLDYAFVPYWLIASITVITIIYFLYKSSAKAVKAGVITICSLALMITVYNAFAVNRIYAEIYSDSNAAWVIVKHGGTDTMIITRKSRVSMQAAAVFERESSPGSLVIYITDLQQATYDISGKFTLDVREIETLLIINDYKILLTGAGNNNAPPANIVALSGWVRNKREFNADYIVYVSRSIPIEHPYEFNAYYEPVRLIIEEQK